MSTTEKLPVDVFIMIEGEPFLSRAAAYRARTAEVDAAWRDFGLRVGAEQMYGHSRLYGLAFPNGARPKDWTAPNRKGWSMPKKGTDAAKELASLPTKPRASEVYGDTVVNDLTYKSPNGNDWGGGGVSHYFDGEWVGWVGDKFVGRIPHVGNAAANHLAKHSDHVSENDAANWKVPVGLREITRAEYNLIVAQHAVEAEKVSA